jgi:hypothetical protein
MGNASTKLFVDCPKEIYAGETLTGTVYIQVEKAVKCNSIVAAIGGKEKTCVHYTTSSGSGKNRKTQHHYIKSSRQVIGAEFNLKTFAEAEELLPGRYEFPVNMLIPAPSPSTIDRVSYDGNWAELTYSIEVYLKTPGMIWGENKIHHVQFFKVHAVPKDYRVYKLPMPAQSHKLTLCCCFTQGSVTIGGSADHSTLFRGGEAPMRFALKNNSTTTITNINVCVEQMISWHAKGRHRCHNSKVGVKNIDPREVAGAGAFTTKRDMKVANLSASDDINQVNDELFTNTGGYATTTKVGQSQGGGNFVSLDLERDGASTYNGNIISVRHKAAIQAFTGCCIDNPRCEVEVQVMAARGVRGAAMAGGNESGGGVPLPADWSGSATVAEAYQVDASAMSIGGTAHDDDDRDAPPSYASVMSPYEDKSGELTWDTLKREMEASMSDDETIRKYKSEITGRAGFLRTISPEKMKELIPLVGDVFLQPTVAMELALCSPAGMTVDMVIAIMTSCQLASIKAPLLEDCLAIATSKTEADLQRIKDCLTSFEQMCCGHLLPL